MSLLVDLQVFKVLSKIETQMPVQNFRRGSANWSRVSEIYRASAGAIA